MDIILLIGLFICTLAHSADFLATIKNNRELKIQNDRLLRIIAILNQE